MLPGLPGGGSLNEDYAAYLLPGVMNPLGVEPGQAAAISGQDGPVL